MTHNTSSKNLLILLSIVLILGVSGCHEPGPVPEVLNFDITSDESLEIVDKYENGWIKEAVRYGFEGNPQIKFTYYSNGHIQSYQLYRQNIDLHTLFLEHTRSEEDLPLTSKYYDVNENLIADLIYEEGLLKTKTLYYNTAKTVFQYLDGKIQSIEKTDSDAEYYSLTTYNYVTEKRKVEIKIGEEEYEEEFILDIIQGTGYNIEEDVPLFNLVGNEGYYETNVNQSSSYSLTTKGNLSIENLGFIPVDFRHISDDFRSKIGWGEYALFKNLMNSDFNRSIFEQYAFVEINSFVSQSKIISKQYSLDVDLSEVIDMTKDLKETYGDDFEKLFGQEYVSKFYTGKNMVIFGTIRNLPSDYQVRNRIIDAAKTFFGDILNETDFLSEEERELLNHVYVQLKVHADVLGGDGIEITNHQELDQIINEINASEFQVINLTLNNHF